MNDKRTMSDVPMCIRAPRVAKLLEISTRTLYRKVARGEFPKPIHIGKGTTRWRVSDVEAYLSRGKAR